jgi:peptidyl-prolyl cis-trans isomerase B (cyclophilin B)
VVAAAPRSADLPTLIEAYGLSTRDPIPDARLAVISALGRLAELDPSGSAKVTEAFARRFPKGTDYLARRAAARDFPGLAARWGPAFPVETGLEVGDYRDIARHLIWPADRGAALPGIVIETDRGSIGIALLVADAPITVNALLRLVERRYFDGGTWQRIVPGFVAQDGDPRGDGSGGPGYALRDELNPHRYQTGTVGMALDGPDTGGSQFFITLAPQPHLNGSYTVFGRVDSGADVLAQLVQGDRIRRVRIRS